MTSPIMPADHAPLERDAIALRVLNSYHWMPMVIRSPTIVTIRPLTTSLSRVLLSRRAGQSREASTSCLGKRISSVLNTRTLLPIFTLSPSKVRSGSNEGWTRRHCSCSRKANCWAIPGCCPGLPAVADSEERNGDIPDRFKAVLVNPLTRCDCPAICCIRDSGCLIRQLPASSNTDVDSINGSHCLDVRDVGTWVSTQSPPTTRIGEVINDLL